MIDIHSHLLPGVDDGSIDISQTIEQLRIISQAGLKTIYLTPHFMRNLYHNTKEVIQPVYDQLKKEVNKIELGIDLELGCEFFIDHHASETIKEEELTLGSSQYVLFETMMQQIPEDIFEQTYKLQRSGYKLIMAHPERYTDVIRKPELVEDFLHRDIYLQMNAGSLLGMYGRRVQHSALMLLEKGYVHFIASDNHGDHHRSVMADCFQLICDNFGVRIAEELFINNPHRIGSSEKIEVINHWRLPAKPRSIWSVLKTFFTGYE